MKCYIETLPHQLQNISKLFTELFLDKNLKEHDSVRSAGFTDTECNEALSGVGTV
jgi:hypothetical protein